MKSFIALAAVLSILAGCVTVVPSTPAKAHAPPPAGPNVSGSWVLNVDSPMGSDESTAMFQQSGAALSGTIANRFGEAMLMGTIDNADVSFSITVDVQGQTVKIDYSGAVTGDAMSGTVKFGDYGEGTWSGKKKS